MARITEGWLEGGIGGHGRRNYRRAKLGGGGQLVQNGVATSTVPRYMEWKSRPATTAEMKELHY